MWVYLIFSGLLQIGESSTHSISCSDPLAHSVSSALAPASDEIQTNLLHPQTAPPLSTATPFSPIPGHCLMLRPLLRDSPSVHPCALWICSRPKSLSNEPLVMGGRSQQVHSSHSHLLVESPETHGLNSLLEVHTGRRSNQLALMAASFNISSQLQ